MASGTWALIGNLSGSGLPFVPATFTGNKTFGTGVPSDTLGVPGDVYLNTVNGDLYQKSGAGVGPPGQPGSPGRDGLDGEDVQTVIVQSTASGAPGPQGVPGLPGPSGGDGEDGSDPGLQGSSSFPNYPGSMTISGDLMVAGSLGVNGAPTTTMDVTGRGVDAFVDQYRATLYVHTTNSLGSAGLAFGNIGAAGVGTQCVIQNVLNRTTGGATTASAFLTQTQDAGNTTFAVDFALQTSINATLGTRLYVNKGGSVVAGAGSLATTATDGFFHIPTCNGAPTGVPTILTGHAPMVYDNTNKKFWMYDAGTATWKGVVLA